MVLMLGKCVFVMGVSGFVVLFVVVELVKDNEVFVLVCWLNFEQCWLVEVVGVQVIVFDMVEEDLLLLFKLVDVVINYVVLLFNYGNFVYDVNIGGIGWLVWCYCDVEVFVYGLIGLFYEYQGECLLCEDDFYGLYSVGENYVVSKIGVEYMFKYLSVDYELLVMMVWIFLFYGLCGGGVMQWID